MCKNGAFLFAAIALVVSDVIGLHSMVDATDARHVASDTNGVIRMDDSYYMSGALHVFEFRSFGRVSQATLLVHPSAQSWGELSCATVADSTVADSSRAIESK